MHVTCGGDEAWSLIVVGFAGRGSTEGPGQTARGYLKKAMGQKDEQGQGDRACCANLARATVAGGREFDRRLCRCRPRRDAWGS